MNSIESIIERLIFESVMHNNDNSLVKFINDNITKVKSKNLIDTSFRNAVRFSLKKTIETCIRAGADVNTRYNANGDTCLHAAIRHCEADIIQLLLDANANPYLQNADGDTPLHLAIKLNTNIIDIQKLIPERIILSTQNTKGNTVLHEAIFSHNSNAIKALLENYADLNVLNNELQSPLHLFCEFFNEKEAIHLMIYTPSPYRTYSKDVYGNTALHIASHNGQETMLKWLLAEMKHNNIIDKHSEVLLIDECIKCANRNCSDVLIKYKNNESFVDLWIVIAISRARSAKDDDYGWAL